MNYAYELKNGIITFVVQNTMFVIDNSHKNYKSIRDALEAGKNEIAYGYVHFKNIAVKHIAQKIYENVHDRQYYFDGLLIENTNLINFIRQNSPKILNKYSFMLDKLFTSYVYDKVIDFVLDNNVLLYTDGDMMCMYDSGKNYYDDLPNTYHIIPYDSNNSHLQIVKVHPGNVIDVVNNSLAYVTQFNDFGVKYV